MHAFGIMCKCCEREVCTNWHINAAAAEREWPLVAPWNNVGFAALDDGQWADSLTDTYILDLTSFEEENLAVPFAIDDSARITRVEFQVNHAFEVTAGTPSPVTFASDVGLLGTAAVPNKGAFRYQPASLESASAPFQTIPTFDLPNYWALSWSDTDTPPTPAEVNAPGFGIEFRYQNQFPSGGGIHRVDFARMKVCYKL